MAKNIKLFEAAALGLISALISGTVLSSNSHSHGASGTELDFSNSETILKPIGLVVREESKDNQQQILSVVSRFAETCPTLFTRYADDVVSAEVYEKWVEIYREERYGWQQEIALEVRMDKHAPVAPGHLVTYYLGDGDRPGWITQKAQGLEPCQREGNSAGDTFVPVHDLFQH